VPGQLYWARSSRHFDGKLTVVEVSTVFGEDPDYWTVAILGSKQHCMPSEFEFIGLAILPGDIAMRHAAE
jgi:hypothetical protein